MEKEHYIFLKRIIRGLNLDFYNDDTLQIKIQQEFNREYGLKNTGFLGRKTISKVKCDIITVNMVKNFIHKDKYYRIFCNKEIGDTLMEKQWRRDIKYLKKYKNKQQKIGIFEEIDWGKKTSLLEQVLNGDICMSLAEQVIKQKRYEDRHVIDKNAYIFIRSRNEYIHFRNKVKLQDEHL